MAQLSQNAPTYAAAGVRIVAIAAQTRAGAAQWLTRNPQPFLWLVDADRVVIKAYGVYNKFSYDAWKMAHPASLLIDQNRTIKFIYRAANQWDIPTKEEMLRGLKHLND